MDREPVGNKWSVQIFTVKSKSGDGSHSFTQRRLQGIVTAISTQLDRMPSLIVLENPAFSRVGGHNHDRSWLWGKIYDACAERELPIITPTPTQRAKYAAGRGNAPKTMVVAHTMKHWPTVTIANDNEADALVLAAIGCRILGLPIDSVPSANYADLMKKLAA